MHRRSATEEGAPSSPARREEGAHARLVLLALMLTVFTYAFQQTAILPVIPTIRHDLHTSSAWSAWMLSGYLMVATVLTPVFGRLADLHGAARVLTWALGVFFLGSLGASFVPDLPGLILCRAAQGAGGPVLPLAFAVARDVLTDEHVSGAIARLTGTFGFGATVGFATGGLMADTVSWHLVFGTGAVSVAVALVVLLRVVPRPPGTGEGTFDVAGAAWLGVASLSVLLGLTVGYQDGFGSPATIVLFLGATAGFAAWARTELHNRDPIVDLRVVRDRAVSLVNLATAGLGWARFVGLLLIPELARGPGHGRYGFGAGATLAGLFLVPDGIGTLLGGPAASRLARRLPPGIVLAGALLTIATGAAIVAVSLASAWGVLVGAFVLGLGGGLAVQASSAVTTRDVPPEDAGVSASLNAMVRRFSGGVGSQISTVILAATAASPGRGFVIAFAVAGAVSFGGALCSLAVPRRAEAA